MKNKLIILCIGLTVSVVFSSLQAQTGLWTLEECIEYAIENNIQIKKQALEQEFSEINLNTSKYSWLPNLNAGISQEFGFGRSLDNNNIYVDRNTASTGAGLSLNMPIFDGLAIPYSIAARKLDLLASIEGLNRVKENMAMTVASYYLQVLYNKEILAIAELRVVLSTEQVERTEALVATGKVPLSQLYDVKAQLANEEVSLAEARNNVKLSLIDLAQTLELERDGGSFDIYTPDISDAIEKYMGSIIPPDNIYDYAVTFKPQIKEQEYLLQSEKKSLKIAQADFYPSLSLNAGYNTGYYHSYGNDIANKSFSDQLKANERKNIGLSVSVPIFNRFTTRNRVRTAKVNIVNRQLTMDNTKKDLYKEIQQAYYEATAAQDKLIASEKSVIASEEAFKYAEERYNAGKSTAYEFNEVKTNLAKSLSEQAQAKYNFIFKTKILDFYNGIPITL